MVFIAGPDSPTNQPMLVVANEVGGLLMPEGDTDAYAGSLARLLKDPQLRMKLGDRAREYVREHHDVGTVAAIFKAAIDPLVDRAH